ncbi:SCP-like protein [Ancylostoma ceylanicum]|uniref:SCP-like protein n=1 Tax=Ancylostoma ceylanicum TaxID=53326 RepID=A0A0D6LZ07_9BILA|nr:SCP-like protein [Ancylostoma ceylanicum]
MRSWAAEGELYTIDRQLPPGENIYAVEWDCKLEELAKKAVENCPTTKVPNPTNGQSFQHYPSNSAPEKLAQPLNESMNDWLLEADQNVDIENEIVVMNKSDKLTNFFNMVRYNTLYIGCSEMKCTQKGATTATAACFYSQPDLKDGDLIYKAGKNCTGGGPCTTYQPARCDVSTTLCVRDPNATTVSPATKPSSTVSPTTKPSSTVSPATKPSSTVSPATIPSTTVSAATKPPTTVPPATVPPSAVLRTHSHVSHDLYLSNGCLHGPQRPLVSAFEQAHITGVFYAPSIDITQENYAIFEIFRRKQPLSTKCWHDRRHSLCHPRYAQLPKRYKCDLEAAAMSRAMQCILQQSDRAERPGQGENQAAIPFDKANNFRQAAELRQSYRSKDLLSRKTMYSMPSIYTLLGITVCMKRQPVIQHLSEVT